MRLEAAVNDIRVLIIERDGYFDALSRIAARCGDDGAPEDNAVQIARQALQEARPFVCKQCEGHGGTCLRCDGKGFVA